MSEYVLLRTFKEKIFEVLITLSERTVTSPALHDEELKKQEDAIKTIRAINDEYTLKTGNIVGREMFFHMRKGGTQLE